MLLTLTLVVLISASDGTQELALHDAAQTALGEKSVVSVRVTAAPPDSPAAAAQLLENLGADAIAVVEWLDTEHRRAAVQLYRRDAQEWPRRTVDFGADDSAVEKGRTLGFAISAMLPEAAPAPDAPERHAPSSASPEPPAPAVSAAPAPADRAPTPRLAAAAQTLPAQATAPEHAEAGRTPSGSIDVMFVGALGLGPSGSGLGGALGGQIALGSGFGLRLDMTARAGPVAAVRGRSFMFDVAPGAVYTLLRQTEGLPWTLELRLAGLVRYMSVSRGDGGDETHDRWLLGARLAIAGAWQFLPHASVIASVGLDSNFGKTTIFQRGHEVSRIDPFALMAGLGMRILL
jgi:hypothetical protein